MRRGARVVLFLAIVVAIIFAVTACAPENAATSPGYVSGDGTVTILGDPDSPVIALTGTAYNGDFVDLADYRGSVVLVNTWYASCPPCRAEAPDLVALDALDGVQVVGINVRDDAETAQAFERSFGVDYPSIDDADGAAVAALQGLIAIIAVPTTLVLDPEGRVYARVIGRVEASTLEALVEDAAGQL